MSDWRVMFWPTFRQTHIHDIVASGIESHMYLEVGTTHFYRLAFKSFVLGMSM